MGVVDLWRWAVREVLLYVYIYIYVYIYVSIINGGVLHACGMCPHRMWRVGANKFRCGSSLTLSKMALCGGCHTYLYLSDRGSCIKYATVNEMGG